ncbi:MAG: OmpA family protein [Gammaproteobacteria bacterium]|nr:OmpA family protein [Gammaproteobacteria bacterium]
MKNDPKMHTTEKNPPAADKTSKARATYSQVTVGPLLEDNGLWEDAVTDSENHWSVPWADLMMVMFVLFAALFAVQAMQEREAASQQSEMAAAEQKPAPEPVLSRQPSFEPLMQINVFERSQQAVRDTNLENVEIVLMDDQSVKVSVQGPMFFELGKADLRPAVQQFLDKLTTIIRQTPYQIQVIGHTDDHPINTELFPSNWELSAVRASRVARYLIQKGNIDPTRFTIMGRSKYQPAIPNADEQKRALNRRVEIIITREISDSLSNQDQKENTP